MPFAVQHTNATIVQDVKLEHNRYYELYLKYYHEPGNGERLRRLAGSGMYHVDQSGKLISVNDGVPVYLELEIVGLDEVVKGFYFEEKLFVGEFIGGGLEWVDSKPNKDTAKPYVYRIIKGIQLKPGLYRITLKSLRDIPELEGTAIAFQIGWH